MSFFRRLSRDRSSKGEQDFQNANSMPNFRPPTSYNDNSPNSAFKDTQYPSTHNSQDMLQYRRSAPQEQNLSSPPRPPGTSSDATMHTAPVNLTSAPDPLTRAFNEAIKPYVEQIELLKSDLEDANLQVQQLEDERADMHAWIDKRGLRPGKYIAIFSNPRTCQLTSHCRPHSAPRINHVYKPNRSQHLLQST